MGGDKEDPKKPTILVIGDWVINDHWYLDRDHAQTSTAVGGNSFTLSADPRDRLSDLGGAGRVVHSLYQCAVEKAPGCQIIGLGQWAREDQKKMEDLATEPRAFKSGDTEQRSGIPGNLRPHLVLVNIEGYDISRHILWLYLERDGHLRFFARVGQRGKLRNDRVFDLAVVDEAVGAYDLQAVVLCEMDGGWFEKEWLVKLVEKLSAEHPKARWYVKTNTCQADSLLVEALKDRRLTVVLDPDGMDEVNPWGRWLQRGRMMLEGKDALEALVSHFPMAAVILLSDLREAVAVIPDEKGENKRIISLCTASKPDDLKQLWWSELFMATIVSRVEYHNEPIDEQSIRWALGSWQSPRFRSGVVESPQRKPFEVQGPAGSGCLWGAEVNAWKRAWSTESTDISSLCDESGGGRRQFHVWRAYTALPEFVAYIKAKRERIGQMFGQVRDFARAGPGQKKRPLTIWLQADPGSGKTLLVENLARVSGLEFLRFDISQMVGGEDLKDMFDVIVAAQQKRKEHILVVVDEIDSTVQGSPTYSHFLSPLESGYFVRRGRFVEIKPCVWVFAGTRATSEASKLKDFSSRIKSKIEIDYTSLKDYYTKSGGTAQLEKQARLEQVYVGASLVRSLHPGVRCVQEALLREFFKLEPTDYPARRIRDLVYSQTNLLGEELPGDRLVELVF